MIGFLIRRIFQALVVTFFVTVAVLALVHLFPGGPIRALLGPRATSQQIAYYNQIYGFDQPFYVQYAKWAWQLLHGNLGYSPKLQRGRERRLPDLARVHRRRGGSDGCR
jgi:peptide/nickel transport system permease protein